LLLKKKKKKKKKKKHMLSKPIDYKNHKIFTLLITFIAFTYYMYNLICYLNIINFNSKLYKTETFINISSISITKIVLIFHIYIIIFKKKKIGGQFY